MNIHEDDIFKDSGNEIEVMVKYIKPGTRLIYNVYDSDGNLVQLAKEPFTKSRIFELLEAGVESIFYTKPVINDQYQYCNSVEEYLDNGVYQGPRTISLESQKKAVHSMQKIVETIKSKEAIELDEIRASIESIINDIQHSQGKIINLLIIRNYDELTYIHSINVGVIAMIFALKLGLDDKQVKNIGLAGFLHDIGKIELPCEIINKINPLTDNEMAKIKTHPVIGHELLKNNFDLDDSVIQMVLLHHEKVDGTGYPMGYQNEEISREVTIVALAEAFDMLTTEHPYRKSFSVREALVELLKDSGKHFNSNMTHQFINEMKNSLLKENHYYSIGTYVLLNTHEVAMVLTKKEDMDSELLVEVLINPFGKILATPLYVDLKMDSSRIILKALDDRLINKVLAPSS